MSGWLTTPRYAMCDGESTAFCSNDMTHYLSTNKRNGSCVSSITRSCGLLIAKYTRIHSATISCSMLNSTHRFTVVHALNQYNEIKPGASQQTSVVCGVA